MALLPEELWREILSYITVDILRKIYAVNRVFFQAYLTRKYHTISIGEVLYHFRAGKAPRYLEHLSEPYISSRVAHLNMVLDHELQSAPVCVELLKFMSKVNPSHTLGGLLKHSSVGGFFYPHPARKIGQPLVQFLRRLRNISTITVLVRYDADQKHNLIVMGFTWMRFSSNLRHLNISGSLDAIVSMLRSPPLIPSLEALCLDFNKISAHFNTDSELDAPCKDITHFVHRCRSLNDLTLRGKATIFKELLRLLILSLGHLSDLCYLSIICPAIEPSADYVRPIISFIGLHARQLVRLTLPFIPELQNDSETMSCEWPTKLKSLVFGSTARHSVSYDAIGVISPLLDASYRSLAELILEVGFLPSEIERMLEIFASSPSNPLTSLQITASALNPHLLEFLSRTFPNLRSLRLEVDCIVPNDASAISESPVSHFQQFYQSLGDQTYAAWYLKALQVRLRGRVKEHLEAWRQAMRVHIPSLETCTFVIVEP